MDLKEYLQILRKNIKLFLAIIVLCIIASFSYFLFRPVAYNTSLTIHISRSGSQETVDYKYDDFYRLQADEKFAETVVEWLKSPRVVEDIYKQAGIDTKNLSLRQLSKGITPEKRSAQLVVVSFSAPDENTANKIAQAVSSVITMNTDSLNKDQKEAAWFEVLTEKPVIRKNDYDGKIFFLGALLVGVFLGFWGVLVKHYL